MQYNEHGEPFEFMMVFNQGEEMVFADTATELCSILIPGYLDIPDDEVVKHTTARILYAVKMQVRAQAAINMDFDLSVATDTERAILTGTRDTPPEVGERWECPIPLVLVEAFYAPFTDRPVPQAAPRDAGAAVRAARPDLPNPENNILWLGFADELDFLEGLTTLGVITVAVNDGDTPPIDPSQVDTTDLIYTSQRWARVPETEETDFDDLDLEDIDFNAPGGPFDFN